MCGFYSIPVSEVQNPLKLTKLARQPAGRGQIGKICWAAELRSGGVSSNERESSLERGRERELETTNWEQICHTPVYFGALIWEYRVSFVPSYREVSISKGRSIVYYYWWKWDSYVWTRQHYCHVCDMCKFLIRPIPGLGFSMNLIITILITSMVINWGSGVGLLVFTEVEYSSSVAGSCRVKFCIIIITF